jgi:hypothetical protein
MEKPKFTPRVFEALIDERGLDDGGVASFTFEVQSLKKGKLYYEQNPDSIQDNEKGVIIDDNGCWWHYGTESFKKRFKRIKN